MCEDEEVRVWKKNQEVKSTTGQEESQIGVSCSKEGGGLLERSIVPAIHNITSQAGETPCGVPGPGHHYTHARGGTAPDIGPYHIHWAPKPYAGEAVRLRSGGAVPSH